VRVLEATAVHDEDAGAVTVFVVNRGAAALPLEVALRDLDGVRVTEHLVLAEDDIDACNTAEQPERVVPRAGSGAPVDGRSLRAELPPRSWNVLRLGGGVLGEAA
jgi:alpha-N-arabinofuranosidase